jgi:hypothetical protein
MKHSIRLIQFNYSHSGKGTTILVLRGMKVREYRYSTERFDSFLDAKDSTNTVWEYDNSSSLYLSFSRIYPES